MRKDMHKVLTERPRYRYGGYVQGTGRGDYYKDYSTRRLVDTEGEGVSLKVPMSMHGKEFSDLLGPLFRFLQGSVGRSWDDVYSEACERLNKSSVTQAHLFTHLLGYVHQDIVDTEDGVPVNSRGKRIYVSPKGTLYVHPKTGVLCVVRPPKEVEPMRAIELVYDKKAGRVFQLENGVWYQFDSVPYDPLYHGMKPPHGCFYSGYGCDKVVWKKTRQISKTEIKKLPLSGKSVAISELGKGFNGVYLK